MLQDVDKAIKDNSGLVYKQLWKFNLINDPEAESIAYEALYNAIRLFDASKDFKLSTYATVIIYNALGSYVRTLNNKRQLQVISYHNVAYTDDSGDHEFSEILPAKADTEKDYIRSEKCQLTRKVFNKQYDKLTNETHKLILDIWNKSDFTATTTSIASQVKVSQSYVSQVINNFKQRLRKELEDVYYD